MQRFEDSSSRSAQSALQVLVVDKRIWAAEFEYSAVSKESRRQAVISMPWSMMIEQCDSIGSRDGRSSRVYSTVDHLTCNRLQYVYIACQQSDWTRQVVFDPDPGSIDKTYS